MTSTWSMLRRKKSNFVQMCRKPVKAKVSRKQHHPECSLAYYATASPHYLLTGDRNILKNIEIAGRTRLLKHKSNSIFFRVRE